MCFYVNYKVEKKKMFEEFECVGNLKKIKLIELILLNQTTLPFYLFFLPLQFAFFKFIHVRYENQFKKIQNLHKLFCYFDSQTKSGKKSFCYSSISHQA